MADATSNDELIIKALMINLHDLHSGAHMLFKDQESKRLYLKLLGTALIKLSEDGEEDGGDEDD